MIVYYRQMSRLTSVLSRVCHSWQCVMLTGSTSKSDCYTVLSAASDTDWWSSGQFDRCPDSSLCGSFPCYPTGPCRVWWYLTLSGSIWRCPAVSATVRYRQCLALSADVHPCPVAAVRYRRRAQLPARPGAALACRNPAGRRSVGAGAARVSVSSVVPDGSGRDW